MKNAANALEALFEILPADLTHADAYYAAYVVVDDRHNFWWKQVALGVAVVAASGLGILQDGQGLPSLQVAADYLPPLALGYVTIAHLGLALVSPKRRFYLTYFRRLQVEGPLAQRLDALLRYPRAAMPSEYDITVVQKAGAAMTALAMLRRLSLIGVVLVAAGTAGFIWLRLLWWLSVEDHGQPHLWLIRMMVILYVFTLAVVVPLMNDER